MLFIQIKGCYLSNQKKKIRTEKKRKEEAKMGKAKEKKRRDFDNCVKILLSQHQASKEILKI